MVLAVDNESRYGDLFLGFEYTSSPHQEASIPHEHEGEVQIRCYWRE
jgi:hypothetical protein